MPISRRDFVRTLAAGATVAGAPFERVYSQAPKGSSVRTNRRHIVRAPAHQLRDGHRFRRHRPPSTKTLSLLAPEPIRWWLPIICPSLRWSAWRRNRDAAAMPNALNGAAFISPKARNSDLLSPTMSGALSSPGRLMDRLYRPTMPTLKMPNKPGYGWLDCGADSASIRCFS